MSEEFVEAIVPFIDSEKQKMWPGLAKCPKDCILLLSGKVAQCMILPGVAPEPAVKLLRESLLKRRIREEHFPQNLECPVDVNLIVDLPGQTIRTVVQKEGKDIGSEDQ